MTYDIEYSEKDVDIIDDFLRKQKLHNGVVYAIIPSINNKLGLHYEIIIEIQENNDTVIPKSQIVKIERLFYNFRTACKKASNNIRVKFYLQHISHNKNILYKTKSSRGLSI